jgi:hypothetical protein
MAEFGDSISDEHVRTGMSQGDVVPEQDAPAGTAEDVIALREDLPQPQGANTTVEG